MGKYIGIAAALALIAYMGMVGALAEYLFPPDEPVSVEQYIAAHTQLSHPLGYAAKVRDCLPSGRLCTEYRYYFSKVAK